MTHRPTVAAGCASRGRDAEPLGRVAGGRRAPQAADAEPAIVVQAAAGLRDAPALERLRLETARTAVETSHAPFERIAEAAGFGEPGRMRRAFIRGFGQPPQTLWRAAR